MSQVPPVPHVAGLYLGKKPPLRDPDGTYHVKLRAVNYLDMQAIKLPRVFGHIDPKVNWGLLGNDGAGDCVIADIYHQLMIDAYATKRPMPLITPQRVLQTYSQMTGYNPDTVDSSGNNPTDQGTDMATAAGYWRKTGVLDSADQLHNSEAFGVVNAWDDILKCVYAFGAVSLGVRLPQSAVTQFNNHMPWTYLPGSHILGGHCITACGYNSRQNLVAITWGRLQAITREFFDRYIEEAICSFNDEYLGASGVSPENFNGTQLVADLAELTTQSA